MKSKKNSIVLWLLKWTVILCVLGWGFFTLFPGARQETWKELKEKIGWSTADSVKVDTTKVDTIPHKLPEKEVKKEIIPLEVQGNLTYINVYLEGLPMKFVLDTGCSGVHITTVEYWFLVRQGLIKEVTGKATTINADGDEHEVATVKVSIRVGTKEIKDVECTVGDLSADGKNEILLGQSVLKELGQVTIDYNKQQLILQ